VTVKNYLWLPSGAVLRFTSVAGNTIEVEVTGKENSDRYGGDVLRVRLITPTLRGYYKHPDSLVLAAATLSRGTGEDTASFAANRTADLKRGVWMCFDDYAVLPRPSQIVSVERVR